ncbi:hypothetical protein AB0B31_11120 [Catellatospora citrea]|uniref:hypothetical protein n=1 Tax=Catellatospora citrea TaxID=53366 RepID=UPI003400809C
MDDTEDLWFWRADVRALFDHLLAHPPTDPDTATLRLYAQGRLRYLTCNSPAPQLIFPGDPESRQRVYAIGHAPNHHARAYPVHDDHGTTRLLGEIDRHTAAHALANAAAGGNDWLSVLDHREGPHIEPADLPRPPAPGLWRQTRISLLGLPDLFDGQIHDSDSPDGFRTARLDHAQTTRLQQLIDRQTQPPAGARRFHLHGAQAITPDGDGFYHFADWPWIVPADTPAGALLPARATAADRHTGPSYLTHLAEYRLDKQQQLTWSYLTAEPPRLHGTPQRTSHHRQVLRAIEHQLLLARPAGYLASQFSPDEVETLIATAAEVIHSGLGDLTERQLALAARADQLRDYC